MAVDGRHLARLARCGWGAVLAGGERTPRFGGIYATFGIRLTPPRRYGRVVA